MNEPYVSVGVLSGKSIKFTLKGIYSTDDVAIVTGEQEATLSDSGIEREKLHLNRIHPDII